MESMHSRRNEFINRLKEGVNNQGRTLKKIQIFKLIDDHPEVLNTLSLEQLKIAEKYYEEDLKQIRKRMPYN